MEVASVPFCPYQKEPGARSVAGTLGVAGIKMKHQRQVEIHNARRKCPTPVELLFLQFFEK